MNNMYSVIIPKSVVFDGKTGNGACAIFVMGSIDSSREISVTAQSNNFSLEEQNASVDKKSHYRHS